MTKQLSNKTRERRRKGTRVLYATTCAAGPTFIELMKLTTIIFPTFDFENFLHRCALQAPVPVFPERMCCQVYAFVMGFSQGTTYQTLFDCP